MSLLHELVAANNIYRLKEVIRSNSIPLETTDNYGNTALLKACYLGRLNCVQILISAGSRLQSINYFGQNALTLATYNGNVELVKYLLKYRSYNDFNVSVMISPLGVAILRNHHDLVAFFSKIHPNTGDPVTIHGVTLKELKELCKQGGSKSPAAKLRL